MRKLTASLNIPALVAAHEQVPDQDPGIAIRMHALRDGAKAAAWLVWHHHDRFKRAGVVDFRIPDEAASPPWLRVALEFLKRSPKHTAKWRVTTFRQGGANDSPKVRVYRVCWLQWKGDADGSTG